MKITIEFSTDNAAFEDNQNEVRNILQNAEDHITDNARYTQSMYKIALMDSNGNTVGFVRGEKQTRS